MSALDRASCAFRRGYRDGIIAAPKADHGYRPGSFAAFDYDEGYKSAANELFWANKRREKKA